MSDLRFALTHHGYTVSCVLRLILLAMLLIGCDSRDGKKITAPPPVIKGNAVIHGTVRLVGTAPKMNAIQGAACDAGSHAIQDETVVIDGAGGLKNVVVTIQGIGPGAGRGETPVLDQVHCTYVPHVLAMTAGQELIVRSSDATVHNVHLIATKNPAMNLAMSRPGTEKRLTLEQPEIITTKCDVHPWMTAYIAVIENPFFAVTSEDGHFEITGLPAGTYKLVAWHELYGQIEQPITLADGRMAEVELKYGK